MLYLPPSIDPPSYTTYPSFVPPSLISSGPPVAFTVFFTGKVSAHVEATIVLPPTSISYFVPGASCTRLPRHSRLRASYQSGSPSLQEEPPAFLKRTAHPWGPGSAGGFQ